MENFQHKNPFIHLDLVQMFSDMKSVNSFGRSKNKKKGNKNNKNKLKKKEDSFVWQREKWVFSSEDGNVWCSIMEVEEMPIKFYYKCRVKKKNENRFEFFFKKKNQKNTKSINWFCATTKKRLNTDYKPPQSTNTQHFIMSKE